ncbi:hypothetical protein KM043_014638 [Ampulex compressa]|nr:hypothetical protein KM043_014638 [Ampulex compressa]
MILVCTRFLKFCRSPAWLVVRFGLAKAWCIVPTSIRIEAHKQENMFERLVVFDESPREVTSIVGIRDGYSTLVLLRAQHWRISYEEQKYRHHFLEDSTDSKADIVESTDFNDQIVGLTDFKDKIVESVYRKGENSRGNIR